MRTRAVTPEIIKRMEELADKGYTYEQIAEDVGFSESTERIYIYIPSVSPMIPRDTIPFPAPYQDWFTREWNAMRKLFGKG